MKMNFLLVECPEFISRGVSRPIPFTNIRVVSIRKKDRNLDHGKYPKITAIFNTL